jgi:hypothetical protein
MAVKKVLRQAQDEKKIEEVSPSTALRTPAYSRWMTASWMILLIAGLGHMMPTQLSPVLGWGMYGITMQMVVGVLSVVAALYYLLEE